VQSVGEKLKPLVGDGKVMDNGLLRFFCRIVIRNKHALILPLLLVSVGCFARQSEKNVFEINKSLGRGINLGNALDAPKEGQWGVVLKEEYFELIKKGGFDSVRIPIRWSTHALPEEPYTIEPAFFERVDWAIKNSLSKGLLVIINMHHYDQIYDRPKEHTERFTALWRQIAEHYKNCPQNVLFELLNEPCKNLNDQEWNSLIVATLKTVRKTNPNRVIIIGPTGWNNIGKLSALKLPDDDKNIIVTCHYYEPFNFTHQGAEWVGEQSKGWLGTKWIGTEQEKRAIIKDFDKAGEWGRINNRPIYIGEFGAYSKADMQSRLLWADFVARQAEKRNFSWGWWEFCSGFGIYNDAEKKWNKPLLNALIRQETE
jgi:endoglucanase